MKVRAYTIEWREQCDKYTKGHKKITAFDNYAQARAKAIEILRDRCKVLYGTDHAYYFKEIHEVSADGVVYHRLKVRPHRHWLQITIQYHTSKSAGYSDPAFW